MKELVNDMDRPGFVYQLVGWLKGIGVSVQPEKDGLFTTVFFQHGDLSVEIKCVSLMLEDYNDGAKVELDRFRAGMHEKRTNGVVCIILWEDVWFSSADLVKDRILNHLGFLSAIPGRLTNARRISKAVASEFLERNHLQGWVNSRYQFGLFLPKQYFRILAKSEIHGEGDMLLVAVATFGRLRIFNKNDRPHRSYELVRYANLGKSRVVGGMSKLLQAFISATDVDEIMTYADLDWSEGDSFMKLGFEYINRREPITFAVNIPEMKRVVGKDYAKKVGDYYVKNSGSSKFVKQIGSHNKSSSSRYNLNDIIE